jgi:hypothetical protein
MTIITKGMGAVLKSIKTLKKSKTFPGPKAGDILNKRIRKKTWKSKKFAPLDVHARIGRTQRERDITATKIREFRKDKGRFTSYTGNPPGANLPEGKVLKIYKPGSKKKDLRKFKEFIKTGTRRK